MFLFLESSWVGRLFQIRRSWNTIYPSGCCIRRQSATISIYFQYIQIEHRICQTRKVQETKYYCTKFSCCLCATKYCCILKCNMKARMKRNIFKAFARSIWLEVRIDILFTNFSVHLQPFWLKSHQRHQANYNKRKYIWECWHCFCLNYNILPGVG